MTRADTLGACSNSLPSLQRLVGCSLKKLGFNASLCEWVSWSAVP